VQLRAGVRLADPQHSGDLGIRQSGEELHRDQLALPRLQPGKGGDQRGAAGATLGESVRWQSGNVSGLSRELGLSTTPAQLIERGVAGDAEQPGAGAATAGVSRAAATSVWSTSSLRANGGFITASIDA
jgi:hypothetical protein